MNTKMYTSPVVSLLLLASAVGTAAVPACTIPYTTYFQTTSFPSCSVFTPKGTTYGPFDVPATSVTFANTVSWNTYGMLLPSGLSGPISFAAYNPSGTLIANSQCTATYTSASTSAQVLALGSGYSVYYCTKAAMTQTAGTTILLAATGLGGDSVLWSSSTGGTSYLGTTPTVLTFPSTLSFTQTAGQAYPIFATYIGTTTCGDGIVGTGEQCDGTNLNGQSCATLGLGSGTLACSSTCTYIQTGCTGTALCGNGVINTGEACDAGNFNGVTCASLGLGTGTLTCSAACTIVTSGCTGVVNTCGTGIISTGQACNGNNLNGYTCATLGLGTGTLTCSSTCTIISTGCTGLVSTQTNFFGVTESQGSDSWWWIPVLIGSLLMCCLLGLLVWYCCTRRREQPVYVPPPPRPVVVQQPAVVEQKAPLYVHPPPTSPPAVAYETYDTYAGF